MKGKKIYRGLESEPKESVFSDAPIIPFESLPLAKYSDEDFSNSTKSGDWLPRLQLMTSQSEKCKEGSFPINHYALVRGTDFSDLGPTIDIAVVSWRPKAIEMGDAVISVYDVNDAEFKRIQDKSGEMNSGCMFGPEFLVWIPAIKEFATFFMGNKSARREAPNVKARMGRAATLKSSKIETAKYTWFAPVVVPCSTPFDLPDPTALGEVVERFVNPPKTEVEKVDEVKGRDR